MWFQLQPLQVYQEHLPRGHLPPLQVCVFIFEVATDVNVSILDNRMSNLFTAHKSIHMHKLLNMTCTFGIVTYV